jgi:RNA polymerase sigma-70 factor, ECF subfamily
MQNVELPLMERAGVENPMRPEARARERSPGEDARLVEQVRAGDEEAGQQFVREHYAAIYRYLLSLTRQAERAADLTQETFLRGWRHLGAYQGRGSLRSWLYQIAYREFLQAVRRQREQVGWEDVAEPAAPDGVDWTEALGLRDAVDRLPLEERELVLLHYLEGYTSAEIARIVEIPAGTVRYRLAHAREGLRAALSGDDLLYLNEPLVPMRQWAWLPLDQMRALEARLATGGNAWEDTTMERREFLRYAAAGAAGLAVPDAGKEVVDGRLAQKVTLAFKATALSDLCERLRANTGVHLVAGNSVADEKVTLFCKGRPLRDVMRQLSRPFGYAWLRSGTPGDYRYELVQDLRSQLLEEELRNRDRHAALLALDREMERYRPLLALSPLEAEARLKTATETEKPLLEKLGGRSFDEEIGLGWGPIQMYFRLSRAEQEALRAGVYLTFASKPEPGEQQLPEDVAQGLLQTFGEWRVNKGKEVWDFSRVNAKPGDLPLTAVPEVQTGVTLWMTPSEMGTLTLDGVSSLFFRMDGKKGAGRSNKSGPYAIGRSPVVVELDNARLNARFAGEPDLRPVVTVQPQPAYRPLPGTDGAPPEAKVTPADLLEAFHQATGLPVVGDHYTRLFPPAEVSARGVPVFQALNQLGDAMRLRWTRDGGTAAERGSWLQFRSASYYDDRLKEVPNRQLAGWSAARQQKGSLSLDDLVEIAGLPDAQLDGADMAEGAREIWGLQEWELPRNGNLRPRLRELALFTPEQRQMAMTDAGLPFGKMSLRQQQQFISQASFNDPLPAENLAGAALRIEYTRPGEFQWGDPGMAWSWSRWFVIREHGRHGSWAPRPSVRGRTREAVVQALQGLDPAIRDGAAHRHPQRAQELATEPPPPVPLETQVFPTALNLVFIYVPSGSNDAPIHIVGRYSQSWQLLF